MSTFFFRATICLYDLKLDMMMKSLRDWSRISLVCIKYRSKLLFSFWESLSNNCLVYFLTFIDHWSLLQANKGFNIQSKLSLWLKRYSPKGITVMDVQHTILVLSTRITFIFCSSWSIHLAWNPTCSIGEICVPNWILRYACQFRGTNQGRRGRWLPSNWGSTYFPSPQTNNVQVTLFLP